MCKTEGGISYGVATSVNSIVSCLFDVVASVAYSGSFPRHLRFSGDALYTVVNAGDKSGIYCMPDTGHAAEITHRCGNVELYIRT